jgi:hypothetical protein
VPGETFRIHVNFPVKDMESKGGRRATFRLQGDARCRANVRAVADTADPMPRFRLLLHHADGWREQEGVLADLGHMEWEVPGNAAVRVEWRPQPKPEQLNGQVHGLNGQKVSPPQRTRRRRTASR